MARRRVGSNQYRTKTGPDLPVGPGILYHPVTGMVDARHPKTSPEALVQLAASPLIWMRQDVAENPSCPPGTLAYLAWDGYTRVRASVARNPGCPPEVLAQLAQDSEWTVRQGVAHNPGCPNDLVEALTGDIDWRVVVAAIQHPGISVESLLRLARSRHDGVRQAAVSKLPEEYRSLLGIAQ